MSQTNNPPRLAMWLLRHARPSSDGDALTGDLIERLCEGQTRSWFWRQVLIAIAVGVVGGILRHWPYFCYAIVGTAIPFFLLKSLYQTGHLLPWSVLAWPWSQLVLEFTPIALCAFAALPVLAAALVVNGTFRWIGLCRTAVINLSLIIVGYYLFGSLRSWLIRPASNDPQTLLSILAALYLLWSFSIFLVSAWLGCLPPRHAGPTGRVPKTACHGLLA
jgi:hypothetical protein